MLSLYYSHEQINAALGSPDDTAHETYEVTTFLERALADAKPPRVKLTDTPRKRVKTGKAHADVSFSFAARPKGSASGFECRLDSSGWRRCKSPDRRAAYFGRNVFKVRALSDRGRPGPAKTFTFRVVER